MILPVAEYAPDQPQVPGVNASELIQNVIPRTKSSYGPFPSLSVFSTGSNPAARVQGSVAVLDTSGNVHVFAGDASKLYHLTAGSTEFSDVSKTGGYSTSADGQWSFALFGNYVIATNFIDVPQVYVLGTSTKFEDLITSGTTSLKARYAFVVKNWLVLANTTDTTDGARPQRVWWSAIDDPRTFPTPGTSDAAEKQSDFQDLVGDAGWIMGGVGNVGTAHGVIFQERAVVRMMFAGPPVTFAFDVAEGVKGTPAPGSILQVGSLVHYLGEDGFYVFDGSNSVPTGAERVDKSFFEDLDQSYFYRITSAVDPINKMVFWAYPGDGHTNGNPNRIIGYNWSVNRWCITKSGDIQCEMLVRFLTPGYSLETLDELSASIDALTLSLDSRIYTNGRAVLGAFNTSHALCTLSGSNLAPTVDTQEMQPFDGRRAHVLRVRPMTDGGTPSIAIGTRNRLQDSVTWGGAVAMGSDGTCPVRAEGRYLRARITMAAGSSFIHLTGIEPEEVRPAGRR